MTIISFPLILITQLSLSQKYTLADANQKAYVPFSNHLLFISSSPLLRKKKKQLSRSSPLLLNMYERALILCSLCVTLYMLTFVNIFSIVSPPWVWWLVGMGNWCPFHRWEIKTWEGRLYDQVWIQDLEQWVLSSCLRGQQTSSEGPDSKYPKFWMPQGLCCNSTLPWKDKSSHRKYINE